MSELDLTYNNNSLPANITQELINYADNEINVPPSFLITLLNYESFWGDSNVGRLNNNWAGMTWGTGWSSPYTRPSGVIVTRGSARPVNEGGHYIKYASVPDFIKDWTYLLRRGGIYKVADSPTFDLAVKGMFKVGGATYDYAELGYTKYLANMKSRRNSINNANNQMLDRIDAGEFSNGSIPNPDPDPDPEPNPPSFNIAQFMKDLKILFNGYLFTYSDTYKGNALFKVTQTYNNLYQIEPSNIFYKTVTDLIGDLISQGVPNPDPDPKPDPEPNPDPEKKWYFPVDYTAPGINFWYPPHDSNIKRDMDYGYRVDGSEHPAYDIGGGGGTNHGVYAITDGVVERANAWSNFGNVVIIKHSTDSRSSLYAHLKTGSLLVNAGDTVVAGQKIATMGNTGGNYAIHLHVEISHSGVFRPNGLANTIDPKGYLLVTGNNQTDLPNPAK